MYQVHLLTLSDNMHATAVYCQLLWIIIIYLLIFFMKCFAEEHFRKVNYLSVATHTVYSACGDLKCCLSGDQITSPPLKRLLSKDAQSDMHSLCEFAVALTVSQNALHPGSVKCVSEREKSDESLNHDSNSVNTKK